MNKKDLDFWEAANKYNLSFFGDADKDKVPNVLDCKPLDPKRDGIFGRIINTISGGKYGQTKEDYQAEQTLKRVEQKRQLEYKLEKQKAINALIKQKIELQKEIEKKQKLKGQLMPQFSSTQQAVNLMFGIPAPAVPQKPGYYIEAAGPKLPKGYKWKKIPKDISKFLICPHCGIPLIPGSGYMGDPVYYCPRCGFVTA